MCFSASASFGAGIILTGIGIASIKKANSSYQKPFAAIPLLFAIQQFSEGFVWLSLSNTSFSIINSTATYLFLLFAQVVWPVWVPFAVLKMEQPNKRKTILKILVLIGGISAAYLAFCLFNYPVASKIDGQHITYLQDYPMQFRIIGGIFYVAATIIPPYFSKIKYMWLVGTAILISYILTKIFYTDYIISVWCFFASLISALVWLVLHKNNKLSNG